MKDFEESICPICHKRLRRNDGPAFTRHVAKCRIRQSRRRLKKRQKEGLPCQ